MAAATIASTRASATFPQGGRGDAFNVKAAYGTITVDAATEDGDIFQLVRLPAGATVIGGWLMSADGDTGIETLDIDLGWAANGVDAADPDGFGNLGVWTGDASKTSPTGNHFHLAGVLQTVGPKTFTAETIIQAETNAAAATGAAIELTVVVLYLYDAA